MTGKRILILSEAFGAGHTKAAEAIKEGILLHHPDWQADVFELGEWLRPTFSHLMTEIYLKTLRYSPKLWGMLYRKVQNRAVKPRLEFILHRVIYAQILNLIREYQPDFIVTTHPFPSAVISRLKRMGLNIPLHTVFTDYGVHGAWVSSGVDYYYLPSMEAKEQLINLGVPKERLFVTGIPTHPKFWCKHDTKQTRQKLGLQDKPTLLYMGGGLGIGLTTEIMDTLIQFPHDIQILIVTGRNETLYHSIKNKLTNDQTNIHLFGFVENIDELMDASNLLITKPGGITSAEAIAKGIPMLLLNPIPGQEEDNFVYILQHKLGISANHVEELKAFLQHFFEDPSLMLTYFNKPAFNIKGQKTIQQLILNAS